MRIIVVALCLIATLDRLNCQVAWTEEEMTKFSEEVIYPILSRIASEDLGFPELNTRVKEQKKLLNKIFPGKPISIVLRGRYHRSHAAIEADSGKLPKGDPSIALYLPAIMDHWGGNEPYVLRIIMHERDHLSEYDGTPNTIQKEIHFQALTTSSVTVPLRQKHGVLLNPMDQEYYDAWIKGGKTEKSPLWQEHVRKVYAEVLR